MPLPLAALAGRAAATGGGGTSVGKVTVEDYTATYLSDAKNAVEQAITKGSIMVQAEAKKLLNKDGGRVTTRNRTTGRFQKSQKARSRPGEPPFNQTGTLVGSIEYETARTVLGEFIGRVGPDDTAPYGIHLEYGTIDVLPRPFLRPALDNKVEEIKKMISGAVKVASKRKQERRDPLSGRFT